MRCPKCGGETDEKKNYCSNCGAELRPRDNSSDKTLRLPDLSNVPLGGIDNRRREAVGEGRRHNDDRPLKITLVVCGAVIIIALAVIMAMLLAGKERPEPAAPFEKDTVDNTPSESYDGYDYDYDEPEDEPDEPKDEPEDEPEEEPEEDPEEEPEEDIPEEPGDEPEDEPEDEPDEPTLVVAEPDERNEE